MWTPIIEAVDKVNGRAQITILYTSDIAEEDVFRKAYFSTTLDGLKQEVQAEIDRVIANFSFADSLLKSIGQPLDTTIIVPGPTPEELARQKYFKDLFVLNQMIEGIKKGIRKENDPDYLAQLDLVKSEFLPEYETLP